MTEYYWYFANLRMEKCISNRDLFPNRVNWSASDNIEIIVKIFKSFIKKLFLFIHNYNYNSEL